MRDRSNLLAIAAFALLLLGVVGMVDLARGADEDNDDAWPLRMVTFPDSTRCVFYPVKGGVTCDWGTRP